MRCLVAVLFLIFEWFEKLKGPMRYRLIQTNFDEKESYKIQLSGEQSMRLHCTELVYKKIYEKWWVPNRTHRIYHVYGVCSEGVPQRIIDRLAVGFHVSQQMHSAASCAQQKRAAIDASISYLAD
mgnify:CR=1 FL=1